MAYNKRKYKKKPYKRRARGANDKTVTVWSDHSVLEKANKALNLASKVYKFVNTEVKYFDTEQYQIAMPATGNVVGLTTVPQGDGQSTRDGDSLKIMGLTIRGHVTSDASVSKPTNLRIIIFRGKQENGVGYSLHDILENPASASLSEVYSPKAYDERFRTKILHDKTYTINETLTTQAKGFNFSIQLKPGGHVNYSAGTTSIENGGIYMLTLSDNATYPPKISYLSRVTYVDN